jgi:hypothetical protein
MSLVPRPYSERECFSRRSSDLRLECTALHWHGMERERRVKSYVMPNSNFKATTVSSSYLHSLYVWWSSRSSTLPEAPPMSPAVLVHVARERGRLTFLFGTCETYVLISNTFVISATRNNVKELDVCDSYTVQYPVRTDSDSHGRAGDVLIIFH